MPEIPMSEVERRPLGRTDLSVSALCLGTMMYGDQISEADAFAQMDRCLERGVTFFDSAEMYTIPPKPETQGESERIVGRWMKQRGVRDQIVMATKVIGRSHLTWFRDGQPARVRRDDIRTAVERSLTNLDTDYIDLYQIHWPDRRVPIFGAELRGYNGRPDADAVPIDEQLSALGELVDEGKVRHIGLSNETSWGVMAFLRAAEAHGLPRVVSVQNSYNFLNRTFEAGLAEIALHEQVGLLAYSPMGQGVLPGKYLGGHWPPGSRGEMFGRLDRYETLNTEPAVAAYVSLARELGFDPAAFAMAFVTSRPWVTSNIFGASSMDQLDVVFSSLEIKWTKDLQDRVDDIHVKFPNPCP